MIRSVEKVALSSRDNEVLISAGKPPRHFARKDAETKSASGAVLQVPTIRARCLRDQNMDQRAI